MPKKRISQEEQFELKARQLLNRIAAFCLRHFRSIGDVFDSWHIRLLQKSQTYDPKTNQYTPFGIILILAGIYFFIQIDSVFSPSTVIYFFAIITLIGFYIIRRA